MGVLAAVLDLALTFLPLAVSLDMLFSAPYSKVEESFNTQAAHDLLFWFGDAAEYDHHAFPGVVPRTFLGSIGLAAMAAPASLVTQVLGWPRLSSQLAVRVCMAVAVWAALVQLARALRRREGSAASRVFLLALASAPHLPFYASRTLPNTFAMAACAVATALWVDSSHLADWSEASAKLAAETAAARGKQPPADSAGGDSATRGGSAGHGSPATGKHQHATPKRTPSPAPAPAPAPAPSPRPAEMALPEAPGLDFEGCSNRDDASLTSLWWACAWFVASTMWFRCDTLVMLAPALLSALLAGRVGFLRLSGWGLVLGAGALLVTVVVDSALWGRWLWPEGSVFLFNAVQNRSSEWGTSPWHWYATSALPRAMLAWLCFVPFGVLALPGWRSQSHALVQLGSAGPCGRGRCSALAPLTSFFTSSWSEFALPAVLFVVLYSALPHKETRFLFPALPLLFATSAVGVVRLGSAMWWVVATLQGCCRRGGGGSGGSGSGGSGGTGGSPPVGRRMPTGAVLVTGALAVAAAAVSAAGTAVFFAASAGNYPGGVALRAAHDVIDAMLEGSADVNASDDGETVMFPGWSSRPDTDVGADASLLVPPSDVIRAAMVSADLPSRWSWRSAAELAETSATGVARVVVHVDVSAAMTGVTRFGERLPSDCALIAGAAKPQGLWARLRYSDGPLARHAVPLSARNGRSADGVCPLIVYDKTEELSAPRDFARADVIVTADPSGFTAGPDPEFAVAAAVRATAGIDWRAALPEAVRALAGDKSLPLVDRVKRIAAAIVADPWSIASALLERPTTLGVAVSREESMWVLLRVRRPPADSFGPPRAPEGPTAGTLRGPKAPGAADVGSSDSGPAVGTGRAEVDAAGETI